MDRALALLAQMKAEGVERNVHTYSALMNVCIKCGQLQLSLEVYQQMMQVREAQARSTLRLAARCVLLRHAAWLDMCAAARHAMRRAWGAL